MSTVTYSQTVRLGNVTAIARAAAGGAITLSGYWPDFRIWTQGGVTDLAGLTISCDQTFVVGNSIYLRDVRNAVLRGFRLRGVAGQGIGKVWCDLSGLADVVFEDFDLVGSRDSGTPVVGSTVVLSDAPWGVGLKLASSVRTVLRGGLVRSFRTGVVLDRTTDCALTDCDFSDPADPVGGAIGCDPVRHSGTLRCRIAGNRMWPSRRAPGTQKTGDTDHPDGIQGLYGPAIAPPVGLVMEDNLILDVAVAGTNSLAGIRVAAQQPAAVKGITIRRNTIVIPSDQAIPFNTLAIQDGLVVEDNLMVGLGAPVGLATSPRILLAPGQVAPDVRNSIRGNVTCWKDAPGKTLPSWWTPSRVLTPAEAAAAVLRPTPDPRTWQINPASRAYGAGWVAVRDGFGDFPPAAARPAAE